jgi:hypothetical protein
LREGKKPGMTQNNNSKKHIRKNKMLVILIFAVGLIVCYPFILNIVKNALSAYLTVNKPVPQAQVLIVEGWLFDSFLPNVKQEFFSNHYKYIIISCGPEAVETDGDHVFQTRGNKWEDHVKRTLISLGCDSSIIKTAIVKKMTNHNTLAMALAAKQWFNENDPAVTRVNICSAGPHGRKTWIAYQRALGKSFEVGIYSYFRTRIPVTRWWKESRGGLRWILLRWVGAIDAAWCPLSWVEGR